MDLVSDHVTYSMKPDMIFGWRPDDITGGTYSHELWLRVVRSMHKSKKWRAVPDLFLWTKICPLYHDAQGVFQPLICNGGWQWISRLPYAFPSPREHLRRCLQTFKVQHIKETFPRSHSKHQVWSFPQTNKPGLKIVSLQLRLRIRQPGHGCPDKLERILIVYASRYQH